MKTFNRKQIEQLLHFPDVITSIEQGFVAYSSGETVIPPVAALHFDEPIGDCHIKYGYAKKGKYYVIKIASGFPNNTKLGLPAGNGLMLLFDKKTGALLSILQDEGYLTDIRTAAAGCIAAKYLAPKNVSCVGLIGTGAQAYYQLKLLSLVTQCRRVMVWGRDPVKAHKLKNHPDLCDWDIEVASDIDQLAAACNLIITTTSSSEPLLFAHQIRAGTHITAMGADDIGKQEIDPEIFAKADRVVVDSRSQCSIFGDASYALKEGLIKPEDMVELGQAILDPLMARTSESQITVADLTGVAIQDLQIARSVFEAYSSIP